MEKRKISDSKKSFLQSIGIDIDNLPPEFEKYNADMYKVISSDEKKFLADHLTGRYQKKFCMKDLVGTAHPDYMDMTWFESFLLTKRGNDAVYKYFTNPEYYSKGLKMFDQSSLRHDSPIELYEIDGKFFVRGGNNRLSLIMMKYLAEVSKAKTEEEKAKIDEKYTFVAKVNPLPKDKDIIYMINMISDFKDNKVDISKTGTREEDYEYTIKIGEKTTIVKGKEQLGQFIKDSYNIEKSKSVEELRTNLGNLVTDAIMYGYSKDKERILETLFPDLQQFKDNFIKLGTLGIEKQFYDGINLNNINISELFKRTIDLVQKEEERINQENQRIQEEKAKKEKEAEEARIKEEQENKVRIEKREKIASKAQNIPTNIETTYNELKQEENKFVRTSKKVRFELFDC